MDKYKYQIIALVIAILIGTVAGYLLSSNNSDKEIKKLTEQHAKELKEEVSGYKQKIHTLDLKYRNWNYKLNLIQLKYLTCNTVLKRWC